MEQTRIKKAKEDAGETIDAGTHTHQQTPRNHVQAKASRVKNIISIKVVRTIKTLINACEFILCWQGACPYMCFLYPVSLGSCI